ncbi:MAG: hypothetical protein K0R44_1817, partial [Thermomicrobiales bacterium]|nr:hypothetical protein [Thermomicrobiales bacterium]
SWAKVALGESPARPSKIVDRLAPAEANAERREKRCQRNGWISVAIRNGSMTAPLGEATNRAASLTKRLGAG